MTYSGIASANYPDAADSFEVGSAIVRALRWIRLERASTEVVDAVTDLDNTLLEELDGDGHYCHEALEASKRVIDAAELAVSDAVDHQLEDGFSDEAIDR